MFWSKRSTIIILALCAASISISVIIGLWPMPKEFAALQQFGGGASAVDRWIDVGESGFSDADAPLLLALREAESLRLKRTKITDTTLQTVGQLVQLRVLNLSYTEITDAGMVHLRSLDALDALVMHGTNITDDGLATLGPKLRLTELRVDSRITLRTLRIDEQFPHLEELVISGSLDPIGAQRIGRLESLTRLDISQCGLDDRFTQSIGALAKLTSLSLDGNQMTDSTAEVVGKLPNIYFVSFNGTGLTDAGLKSLVPAATLKQLRLKDTRTTSAGIAQFQAARPDVKVRFDD